jgi:hypothetical protein
VTSQELVIPRGDLLLLIPQLLTEAQRPGRNVGPAFGSPGTDPRNGLFASGLSSRPLEEGRAGNILMSSGGGGAFAGIACPTFGILVGFLIAGDPLVAWYPSQSDGIVPARD